MRRWELWVRDKRLLDRDFNRYLKYGDITKGSVSAEVEGHIGKARRNLNFSRIVIDELDGFYEWAIISYYYAVYHAALALCATRGYATKKHLATICILVKFFYPRHISEEGIMMVEAIAKDDIQEFAELKDCREDASYSVSTEYDIGLAERLSENAIDFVSKAERIILRK